MTKRKTKKALQGFFSPTNVQNVDVVEDIRRANAMLLARALAPRSIEDYRCELALIGLREPVRAESEE